MHSLPEITPPTFPTLNTITTPIIHLIFGPQGAGKTTYLRQLADWSACTRFSIDDWMSELFSPDITRPLSFPWVIERVARCEKRIWAVACDVARQGGNVALDLGFMKAASRAKFAALANSEGLPTQWHYITTPHELRKSRVMTRNANPGETFSFEVTPGMFDFMETQFEAPTAAELATCVMQQV